MQNSNNTNNTNDTHTNMNEKNEEMIIREAKKTKAEMEQNIREMLSR